jgi:hypothetical protein
MLPTVSATEPVRSASVVEPVTATLPFAGTAPGMKHGQDSDSVSFNREVHGVGKAPQQGTTDTGPELTVAKWTVGYAVVGCTELVQELSAKPGSLMLIPVDRPLDVEAYLRRRRKAIRAQGSC